jgi:hypothetical protein
VIGWLFKMILGLIMLPFDIARIIFLVTTGHRRCWMCEDYRDLKGKPDPICPGCNGSGLKKEK